MRSLRRSLSLLACLIAVSAPSAAFAQTPGDDQYSDPFGGSQDGGEQPEEDEAAPPPEEAPIPEQAPAPAPAAESAPPAQPDAAPSQASEQLPYTGADAGLLALGGVTLLVGGVALRVRLRA